MRRDIGDLDVVGDDVLLEALRNGVDQAGLKIEQNFIFEQVNVKIAQHLSFGCDQRRVTAFTDLQCGHIIRDLAIEKPLAVRTEQAKASAKTQVEHARALTQGSVFSQHVAVIVHGLLAVQLEEPSAYLLMKFLQRQRIHDVNVLGEMRKRMVNF